MVLKKKKYRYICLLVPPDHYVESPILIENVYQCFLQLFGYIKFHKSLIRSIQLNKIEKKFVILKCSLSSLNDVLISLYFINFSKLILFISGTIKSIKKKIKTFEDLDIFK